MELQRVVPTFPAAVSTVTSFHSRILRLQTECRLQIARTPEQIYAAHLLRHQVYRVERGYDLSGDGIEIDEYDCRSHHAILTSRLSGEAVGTVRLVVADPAQPENSFPMQHVSPRLDPYLPVLKAAEISRFAISKQRQGTSPMMRLYLMRGILQLSMELGLTHWCATMEPSLLRMLQATAIHFRRIGGLVEHHGPRQPCYNAIDDVMSGIEAESPELYDFFTDGGRIYPPRSAGVRAVPPRQLPVPAAA